jgi:hypothetical protein
MSQKRYFNFLDDDATYDIAGMNLPVSNSGRVSGFDTMVGSNITNFSIGHSDTGYTRVNKLQVAEVLGAWVSLTGVIVTETESINDLSIVKNLTDFTRIDILTGSHEYLFAAGGMEAFYGIVQGQPAENPAPPPVSDTIREVILGYLIIPPGTISLDTVTYCPANSNYLKNDKLDTRYNTPGWFTHHNKVESMSVGMGTVEAVKTTLKLNPIRPKDKLVHGYSDYYPNYYFIENIPGSASVTTFAKIEAPGISENQIINLINPFNKLAISESAATTLNNIHSTYPNINFYYPGDVITLLRKNGRWYLLNSESVSNPRKLRDRLSFSYADYTLSNEALIPASSKKGNVLRVQIVGNEPQILSYLPASKIHTEGDSEGSVLFVEFLNNSSFNLTIFHARQSPPEGYKPIYFAGNEQNFTTNRGNLMLGFVETRDGFKPINWDLNPTAPSQSYANLLDKNETKFTYIDTGVRAENLLVRMKGKIQIIADEAAAPDIGRVFKLYPGTIPETERRIPTYIYHENYDFGITPSSNANKPIPVIITIQGQNTPQPGFFISGGGYIPYDYVLYLDGLQYDIK